ncbi:MAG: hypothetical protein KIT14_22660 [bacterium]|nr:hypothetical protein [bacterium]
MDTLLAAAVALALAQQPRPLAAIVEQPTVGLIVTTRRETRIRGLHMALATSPAGEIVGALVDRKGRTRCTFVGFDDGVCVYIDGCGRSGRSCR